MGIESYIFALICIIVAILAFAYGIVWLLSTSVGYVITSIGGGWLFAIAIIGAIFVGAIGHNADKKKSE
jgi:hypothetical protein